MEKTKKLRQSGFKPVLPKLTSGIIDYFIAALAVIASAGICYLLAGYIGYRSVSFLLLFVVSILSVFLGIGPIAMACAMSAIIWNFFFIPPTFTINIDNTEDALMLGMFFVIALVNGVLTSRIRRQERMTRDREQRTNALYLLSKELSMAANMSELIDTARKNIFTNFGFDVILILQDGSGNLTEFSKDQASRKIKPEEMIVAQRVFENDFVAGKFSSIPFPTDFTFYPLKGMNFRPGVMAAMHTESFKGRDDEFWGTFLALISGAIEREFLNDMARKARLLDESDKLYKTLFNSLSHELRIPVATLMSASEALQSHLHSEVIRKEISGEIIKASTRLNRLIDNLLNMSRLESGQITPRPDWYDIHDLLNKVADTLSNELRPFSFTIHVAEDMPLVRIDFGLMEQVLYNLVYNATQYTPESGSIEINAHHENYTLTIEVMDSGTGFAANDLPHIFEKFFRPAGSKTGGTGLGLSIAKGFTEAHQGKISARNREGGGAKFTVSIPSVIPQFDIKQ